MNVNFYNYFLHRTFVCIILIPMKGVISLSSSSKKSPKKDKKSKLKPRNINVTYPGVLDHRGWKKFKSMN